jgi:hypothetical protein
MAHCWFFCLFGFFQQSGLWKLEALILGYCWRGNRGGAKWSAVKSFLKRIVEYGQIECFFIKNVIKNAESFNNAPQKAFLLHLC